MRVVDCCSATLFYIVKMKERVELVARMKKRIISALLAGMSTHRDEETMMRNGCLALCQFRIPQDVVRVALSDFRFLHCHATKCPKMQATLADSIE